MLYEFRSAKNDGTTISVIAVTEEDARRVAMERLWGPPRPPFANLGTGLILIRKRKVEANAEVP